MKSFFFAIFFSVSKFTLTTRDNSSPWKSSNVEAQVIPYAILPLLANVDIAPKPSGASQWVIVSPSVPSLISPNENDTVEMEPCFLISLKHPLPSSHLTGARCSPVSARSGPQRRLSSSATPPAPGPSSGLPRRRRSPDTGGRRGRPDLGSLRPAQPGHGHHQRCVWRRRRWWK